MLLQGHRDRLKEGSLGQHGVRAIEHLKAERRQFVVVDRSPADRRVKVRRHQLSWIAPRSNVLIAERSATRSGCIRRRRTTLASRSSADVYWDTLAT